MLERLQCQTCLNDHATLFHIICKQQKLKVVSVSRAKEVVGLMHQHKTEGKMVSQEVLILLYDRSLLRTIVGGFVK